MFEKIVSITKNFAIVKISNNISDDILNYYVIFEDNNRKILGEIEEVINNEVKINFLGEYINNNFCIGIIRRPTVNSAVRIINQQELGILVGDNDCKSFMLGVNPLYNNYPVKVNIDSLFSNHTAIIGDSGVGKTYGIARIIQNFFSMKDKIPFNSNFIIFNTTLEYTEAFKEINNINNGFNYKLYSNKENRTNSNKIKIPLCLLDINDYIDLLNVENYTQVNILEKALKYVYIFARKDKESIKYKNHIIAKNIMCILYSNQLSSKIRDQIFSILNDCYTDEINLDVKVPGIGYTKELRKCFDINEHGEFSEFVLISKYINSFIDNNLNFNEVMEPSVYNFNQLEEALNFALLGDRYLLNEKSYEDSIYLKVKLTKFINSDKRDFFDEINCINCEQFINSLIVKNNNRAQIVNFVLDDMDILWTKSIVKLICNILFKFLKNDKSNKNMPFNIILEDAHYYIDSNDKLLKYNIFDKIAKEGKNIGLIMSLVTDKPNDLTNFVLSKCSNFIIFRSSCYNNVDNFTNVCNYFDLNLFEKQRSLQFGTCIIYGNISKIPMIIKLLSPLPEPKNSNISIYDRWIVDWNK